VRETTCRKTFHRIIAKRGYSATAGTLAAGDRVTVADLVNLAIQKCWERAYWPEVMKVEQRQFRQTWDTTDAYAVGDEVLFEDSNEDERYYISLLTPNTGKNPETQTTYWSEVGTEFLRTIDLRQAWEDQEIGMLDVQKHLYDRDPRAYPDTGPLKNVYLEGDSIYVRPTVSPVKPWVKFRPPYPQFSWTEWSSSVEYGVGDLIYQDVSGSTTVGETFIALQSNTNQEPYTQTDDWEPVPFPLLFQEYVVHRVAAEEKTEDEGRRNAFGLAAGILQDLEDTWQEGQGQRKRAVYTVGS